MMSYTVNGGVVYLNNRIKLRCHSQERPSCTVCTVILHLYATNQKALLIIINHCPPLDFAKSHLKQKMYLKILFSV